MNDLVSRQAVLDMAIYTPVAPIYTPAAPILVGGPFVWRHVIFKENVENLPAVKPETESIIRCKDCEFWERHTDSLQGICYLLRMNPTGMWYCANARPINDGYQNTWYQQRFEKIN